jgi:hypothetical protein
MKRNFIIIICAIAFHGIVFGQSRIAVAVLEHDAAGVTQAEAEIISDRLRTELFKTEKFTVLERDKMNDILSEMGFQQSGCTSNECAVEIGKLIGVQLMFAGKIGKIGNMYTINSRMIDVQTGKVLRIAVDDCKCPIEDVLTTSVTKVANILSGTTKQEYDERINQLKEQKMIEMSDELKDPTLAAIGGLVLPIAGHAYIGTTSNIIRGSLYTAAAASGIYFGLSEGLDERPVLFWGGIAVLVISAVDAGLSANSYNDDLISENLTIDIKSNFYMNSVSLSLNYQF